MKRWLVIGAAATMLSLPLGSEVNAQSMVSPSRFDIGVYAGGSWTSDWFESRRVTVNQGVLTEEEDGVNYGIGVNPAFGGMLTYWAMPMIGIRLHGAYIPSFIPTADDDLVGSNDVAPSFFDASPRPLNNWLYDLSLVARPWIARADGGVMSTMYVFAGGGLMEAGLTGGGESCEPSLLQAGACLSYHSDHATVGQGTVGLGFDLFPLTNGIGLFAELAGHGYNSPIKVDDEFVPMVTIPTGASTQVADQNFSFTTRLVAGLKLALGGGVAAPMVMAPPPPPPPAPPPPAPAPPAQREIMVCVIENGMPQNVSAMYNPATQDTMVAGQRFSARYPAAAPAYAAGAPWFAQSDTLAFNNQVYVRFGVTRVIQPPQLSSVGNYQGTALFGEAGAADPQQVLYVPARPGCEFQPYRLRETIRPRG